MSSRRQGFTLVELLVVLVIIGILASLAMISLNSARMRARDAKRVSDVRQMQAALELYFSDVGIYPPSLTVGTAIQAPATLNSTQYMAAAPTPPAAETNCTATNDTAYLYVYDSASTYHMMYCLGGKTGDISAGPHTATPSGIQ